MKQTTSAIIASAVATTTNALALQAHLQAQGPFKGLKKGWNNFTDKIEDAGNATNDWFRGDFADFWREDFVNAAEKVGDGLETGWEKTRDFTTNAGRNALAGVIATFTNR